MSDSVPPRPGTGARSSSRLFGRYTAALTSISQRTGAPLPSLIFSFAVLHEASTVVSLLGFFALARAGGVGEKVVRTLRDASGEAEDQSVKGWVIRRGREWLEEGEKWAERIGRRYGFFGYEKGSRVGEGPASGAVDLRERVVGDVANVVVAYAVTKVCYRPGWG